MSVTVAPGQPPHLPDLASCTTNSFLNAYELLNAKVPLVRGTPWSAERPLCSNWIRRRKLKWGLAVAAALWIMSSTLRPMSDPKPTIMTVSRYAKHLEQSVAARGKLNVGLALSEGGYRAAVFHSGVVDALEHFDIVPTHLSSVSGGSIFASYYASGGDPDRFRQLVVDGRFRLRRRMSYADEAIGAVLSLVPALSLGKSRLDVQGDVLNEAFLGKRTMADFGGKDGPKWIIATTDLLRGWAVGFGNDGEVFIQPALRAGERLPFSNATARPSQDRGCFAKTERRGESPSAAQFVAASGAFPVAFNAFRYGRFLLADGGVADNTALGLLLTAHGMSVGPRVNVICDWSARELSQSIGGDDETPRPAW
jgi:predicted acylesterase/phospholipase RssA